jgi:hypothetical protein
VGVAKTCLVVLEAKQLLLKTQDPGLQNLNLKLLGLLLVRLNRLLNQAVGALLCLRVGVVEPLFVKAMPSLKTLGVLVPVRVKQLLRVELLVLTVLVNLRVLLTGCLVPTVSTKLLDVRLLRPDLAIWLKAPDAWPFQLLLLLKLLMLKVDLTSLLSLPLFRR